jgi:hypothetical protein
MSAHAMSRKLVLLAAVLCLMVAAAFGGYAAANNRTSETLNLAGAQAGASGQAVTIHACLASGKLTRVSMAAAPKCPAKSVPVQWSVQSGPASSPKPLPSSAPSSRPSSSSSPSQAPSASPTSPPGSSGPGTACVRSANNGTCGPYDYAGISGSGSNDTLVIQDVWNPIKGGSQTLTAYNPGNWSVSANMPAGNTGVVSYPDTQQIYTRGNNTPDPLSGFGSITSSFTEKMNAASGTSAEAAYDIWLGQNSSTNYADEVMIWNDQANRGTCGGATVKANASFGGANGVPQQNWTLCKWGSSELIWYLTSGKEPSGVVDILSMLTWLESHGYLPANSGVNLIDYGFEICSTSGAETFTVSRFAIESACNSGVSC